MRLRPSSFLAIVCLSSAPAIASAEILWRGDFETGDLMQWDTLLNPTKGDRKNIEVVTMPVHGGTRAAEVVIHPDDLWQGNNHNRVELHYDAVESRTAEGQTTYFSFYFRLPANAQTTNDIAYWETANSYQQSMAFWVEPMGGGTQLSFRTNHPSGKTHFNGPITVDAWHQLAMQILWSENASTGRVNVWLDGQKIVDDVAAKTKPDSNRVFVQIGYHRNASATPVETIYLDDAVEATTLAEVLAQPTTGGSGGAGGASGTGGASGGAPSSGAGGMGIAPPPSGAGGAGPGSGGDTSASGSAGQSAGGGVPSTGGASAGGPSTGGTASGGAPVMAGGPGVAGAAAAGAPGSGVGGAPASAGGPGAAGSAGASDGAGDDGCSCRVVGKPAPAWALAWLALGIGLARRRRR